MTPTKKKAAAKPKRNKKVVTITLERDTDARLRAVTEKMPGSNLSGLVNQLMLTALPMAEAAADAMVNARQADGTIDSAKARDELARWAGAQVLQLYDTQQASKMGGEQG